MLLFAIMRTVIGLPLHTLAGGKICTFMVQALLYKDRAILLDLISELLLTKVESINASMLLSWLKEKWMNSFYYEFMETRMFHLAKSIVQYSEHLQPSLKFSFWDDGIWSLWMKYCRRINVRSMRKDWLFHPLAIDCGCFEDE